MAAKVRFGGDARAHMLRGVDILSSVRSRSAQGPQCPARKILRRAAHHQGQRRVAKEIGSPTIQEHGHQLCAGRDQDLGTAGDGATTATVLAEAIVREGQVGGCGMNPMDLKRGIELAAEWVMEELKGRSRKVSPERRSRRSAPCR